MRRKLLEVATVIFLVIIISCGGKELNFCSNEKRLISSNDSLPTIELDFSLPQSQLEQQIRHQTSAQSTKSPSKFGLVISGNVYNASIHAAHFIQPACYGMPAMRHKAPQLEVFLNQKDQLMMEGKDLISIDSIPGYIAWYYPHDRPFGEKIVKLKCHPLSNVSSVHKVIENIAAGYMMHYEKEARTKLNKSICELDSSELKITSKKYPFELRLWIGDAPAVLIPPVPTEVFSEVVL